LTGDTTVYLFTDARRTACHAHIGLADKHGNFWKYKEVKELFN